MTVSGVRLLKARAGPAPRAPPTVKVPWRRMSVKLCPPESCRLRAPVPRAHAGVQLRRSGPSSHRLSTASGPRRLLPCLGLSFLFSALIFLLLLLSLLFLFGFQTPAVESSRSSLHYCFYFYPKLLATEVDGGRFCFHRRLGGRSVGLWDSTGEGLR